MIPSRIKYPRTPHLPWSEGASFDDIHLESIEKFQFARSVVVTEKLDGENTTLYRDGLHARSLDSGGHPARSWVAAMHASLAHRIPDGTRICGENMFAQHSIRYELLPSYFMVFAVFREDVCLCWDETEEECENLGFETVPVLYQGPYDEARVKACWTGTSRCGGVQEGYVVRTADSFLRMDFAANVGKFVRKDHVTDDEHWRLKPIIRNGLCK